MRFLARELLGGLLGRRWESVRASHSHTFERMEEDMRIREIMTTDLVTVPPTANVQQVARLMRDADIGDVLITDGGRLAGIVTDRDIVVRAVADGVNIGQAQVGDFMTRNVFTISPDSAVEDAARLMADEQIRRLPIVENGGLVGIVSLGDIAVDMEAAGVQSQSPAGEALEDISKPAEPRLERLRM